MPRSCHRWTRLDRLAGVCFTCQPRAEVEAKTAELEVADYTVVRGYCHDCVERFHLDSIRGTKWALAEPGRAWGERPIAPELQAC